MTDITHLTLEFNKQTVQMERTYALDAATRRTVDAWLGSVNPPSTLALADWLEENKVPRDRTDGPAVIETRNTGYRCEVYYQMGKLHRLASEGPAVVETWPTGYRQEQDWENGRQLDVRRIGDSTGIGSLKPLKP